MFMNFSNVPKKIPIGNYYFFSFMFVTLSIQQIFAARNRNSYYSRVGVFIVVLLFNQ